MANTIKHVIATYNMSFASDQNLDPSRPDVYESEGAFTLQSAKNTRAFWLEALELVKHFWKNEPNVSAMGLQEMNKDKGAKDVETAIITINKNKNKHIKVVTEEVITKFSKPAVSIIWDSEKLGDIKYDPYIKDLTYEHTELSNQKQDGRPIIIIYTTKGYLLINCHGPNFAEASKKTMKDFREQLNFHINTFLTDNNITDLNPSKLFLMGDLNDRYDAINDGIDITINNDKTFKLSYKGKAPYSCCHNWDSSCSSTRFDKLEIPNRQTVGTCKVPRDTNGVQYTLAFMPETIVRDENGNQLKDENGNFKKIIDSQIKGQRYLMYDEGLPKNYRYTGDKVFGEKPKDLIKIYRPIHFKGKNMSDHEMVIGTFESIYDRNDLKTTGTKLRGGYLNKNKSKKYIKSNKSRKVKQHNKKHKTRKTQKYNKSRKH